MTRTATP